QGTNEWYQDLNIKVDLSDNLSGIKTAKYCVTTNDTCTPDVTATISSNSYTVTLTSNVSAQKVCSQVTDNANNTSDIKCSNTYKVDTTDPSQNFSIASSTSGTNNWYTALSVKVTVSDLDSKVASAKYCVTTNDTCTPDTMATLSNNEFSVTLGTNASAQKVCVQTTDNAGRTNSVTCSQAYKVDTVNPIAQVNANRGDSSITLSAASSSDSGSGISTYYYSKDNGSTWQTSATSTYTFTGLSFKEYTFAIKVIDKAGRTSSVVTTKATPLVQLYRTITASAPLDNTSSTYVSSSTGIDFGAAPSDTNGKGIYKLSSTINDTNPIYYYRGEVTNNNVKFARLCWKIVRTTDTAGIKLIYNGAPDSNGGCTNTTGTSTQIRFGAFNTKYDSADYVGYMYPETTNANNSTIKTYIDDWYSKNMTNYTKYLEDTVWCNNRRIARDDSDETDVVIYYEGNENLYLNNKPKLSLVCPNNNDKFTVSSTKGNGKLTYPVAVLTADEATFAGHGYKGSRKSYLCTNQSWWTMTPSNYVYIDKITTHNTDVFAVSYGGSALPNDVKNPHEDYPEVSIGIRPSVSLNSGILINSGNGTANNPYQIYENK
ncbi:MAG: hypothetical protein HFG48_02595, partial [Bacilli bacterium]|nr:hypothetical protein [Bacilli bacterium]